MSRYRSPNEDMYLQTLVLSKSSRQLMITRTILPNLGYVIDVSVTNDRDHLATE